MKRSICCLLFALGLCLPACQPMPTPASPGETLSATPLTVEPFMDVRNLDLQSAPTALGEDLLLTLWFNLYTRFPASSQADAQAILEKGKNPGLGVRSLHEQGITGEGVNIAIIDQNLLLDHPEFEGKFAAYHDTGTGQPPAQGSMHAPAVTSLLVGETIGTAPGARVWFAATPSWTLDAAYQAAALDWIIAENAKLPEGGKIRVVSISAAPSGEGSPFTQNNLDWDEACQRARQAGILVLDRTVDRALTAPCYLDLDHPDDPANCTPGWPGIDTEPLPEMIHVPTSRRTTAEEYQRGAYSYQYTGLGGNSWSVPYLAGILALGWQVRPDLSGSQLLELIFSSAHVTDQGLRVIDPPAFIEQVRLAPGE